MNSVYRDIKALLTNSGMEEGEARAVTLLLMEKAAGLSPTDALTNAPPAEEHRTTLLALAERVAQGEPVQYVLGEADFCSMTLKVAPGVLIPRKETEELVKWVEEEVRNQSTQNNQNTPIHPTLSLLDVGTGSGCIAIALARCLPHTHVEAWDISEEALGIARENAQRQQVDITFQQVDVMSNPDSPDFLDSPDSLDFPGILGIPGRLPFSVVISNPPYICREEAREMEPHVLEHEPDIALFVPDNDPLRFYRRIAELGRQGLLAPDGLLFFEVNRRFGHEVVALLEQLGYREVELRKDIFGNDRMVKAINT
jgi:release factor glutamine methyltransferase